MGIFLSVREVATGYDKRKVLHGASVHTLKPGTMTGLLSPSAASESTLMTALAEIRKLMSGKIMLTRDSEQVIGSKLYDIIGYIPQDLPASASLTTFEPVLVSRRYAGRLRVHGSEIKHTTAALRKADIRRLAGRLVDELSDDQHQLVAVTQVFICGPEVILLNESISALDLRHQMEPLQLVRAKVTSRDPLALVAIYDLNLAARCYGELIVLYNGRVVTQGSPVDVLAPDLLTRVYGIQARVLDDEDMLIVCPTEEGQVSETA